MTDEKLKQFWRGEIQVRPQCGCVEEMKGKILDRPAGNEDMEEAERPGLAAYVFRPIVALAVFALVILSLAVISYLSKSPSKAPGDGEAAASDEMSEAEAVESYFEALRMTEDDAIEDEQLASPAVYLSFLDDEEDFEALSWDANYFEVLNALDGLLEKNNKTN